MTARALCPECGHYVATTGAIERSRPVEVLAAHDIRRGVQCGGTGKPWRAVLVAHQVCEGAPLRIAEWWAVRTTEGLGMESG